MRYLTYNCQKNGRYTLGTLIHSSLICPRIKGRKGKLMKVTGEILNVIPPCKICREKRK